jgi:hypothetical protein
MFQFTNNKRYLCENFLLYQLAQDYSNSHRFELDVIERKYKHAN